MVRGVEPGASAPAMAVDKFELEADSCVALAPRESALHFSETMLSDERAIALLQGVSCTDVGQVGKQFFGIVVTDSKAIDVQHGIPQAGPDQGVANVVHVGEAVDVRAAVKAAPCAADFEQAVGTKARESEHAAFFKYACDLLKDKVGTVSTGQEQVRKNEIDALVFDGQAHGIRLHLGVTRKRKPGALANGLAQHAV